MIEITSSTTTAKSALLSGEAKVIGATVSCTYRTGIGITVEGIAGEALRKTLLRVSAALEAVGFRFPGRKIEIAVTPATQWRGKCTTHLDLPMAVALLEHSRGPRKDRGERILAGELNPSGGIVPTWMTQQMWREAEESGTGGRTLFLPQSPEAAGRPAPEGVVVVASLKDVAAKLW